MIYLLSLSIFLLLILSAAMFKKDLTAPSFLLMAGFSLSVMCCCIYANEWEFHDYRLMGLIISGLLGFLLFSWITYYFDRRGMKKMKKFDKNKKVLQISQIKLLLYLLFQILLMLIQIYNLYRNFGGGSLADAIGNYYNANMLGTLKYKSPISSIGNILNMPATYLILYVTSYNIVHNNKNCIWLYVNIVVSFMNSLMDGTRTTLFMYMISFFVMYIIQKQRISGWKKNINLKNLFKLLVLFMIGIVGFNFLFFLQGRSLSDITVVDLIANYLGAPIKNLELFIGDKISADKIFGETTFMNTYSWFNELLGGEIFNIPDIYTYRWINGKILGNVYTQFMPLYCDFGIVGTFIAMGIIGTFCQKIYDRVRISPNVCGVDYSLLFYSYVAFAIVFCFFSNKFFELVFARALIYNIIGVWLFDILFFRMKMRNGHLVVVRLKNEKVS